MLEILILEMRLTRLEMMKLLRMLVMPKMLMQETLEQHGTSWFPSSGLLACGSKPMVPFWGRCTTHFSQLWGLGCSLGVRFGF